MNFTYYVGVLTLGLTAVGYVPYLRDTFKRKTKPHLFSWFIWGLLAYTAFAIQVDHQAGPGAWINGLSVLTCGFIFLLAFWYGEKNITIFDWVCLLLAAIAYVLWWFADQPLLAMGLTFFTDTLAFLPTLRKSYLKPHEETPSVYWTSALAYGLSVFAIHNFTPINVLYPIGITLLNLSFLSVMYLRRYQLRHL